MKRIQLTESQLYELVEQALNELDWRTYMSAAEKRGQQKDATWDALRAHQNGVGNPTDYDKNAMNLQNMYNKAESSKYDLMKAAQNSFNNKYGSNHTFEQNPNYKREEGIHGSFQARNYNPYTGNMRTVRNGEATEQNWGASTDGNYYPPNNGVMSYPDAMMANYQKGDAKYNRDRGKWESPDQYWNESLAHRVTESVMRKLRRLN